MIVILLTWLLGHWHYFVPHWSTGPYGWEVWIEPARVAAGFGHDATGWNSYLEFQ